jgi:hypothetical protein
MARVIGCKLLVCVKAIIDNFSTLFVQCIASHSNLLPIYELSTLSIVGQKGQKKLKEDFGTALQTNYLRQKVKSRQSLSNLTLKKKNIHVESMDTTSPCEPLASPETYIQ